jgi:hypothetical protein
MDSVLKVKLQSLISNPGFIITRPLVTSSVTSKKGEGTRFIDNAVKLESVEVLVGNGEDRGVGVPRIFTGDLVYIKSDRYTQVWAKERLTLGGLEETVDGKVVPLQFIVVPINEVVMVSVLSPDYSKYYRWPDQFIGEEKTPHTPVLPYWPSSPPVIYGDPLSFPNGLSCTTDTGAEKT